MKTDADLTAQELLRIIHESDSLLCDSTTDCTGDSDKTTFTMSKSSNAPKCKGERFSRFLGEMIYTVTVEAKFIPFNDD